MSFERLLDDMHKNRLRLAAILLTVLLLLVAIYFIMPLADGVIFGIFFFFITRPLKDFLGRYTKYSPYIATICLLLPLIILIVYGLFVVWDEAQWVIGHAAEISAAARNLAAGLGLPFDVSAAFDQAFKNIYDYAIVFIKSLPIRSIFSSSISLAMNALISIFVCFYMLKDGGSFVKSLKGLVPVSQRGVMDMFLAEADRLLSGIYVGTFYTALFVALGSLIVFVIFGVPYKALLTAFVFIAAMIPIISGMMVFIPLTAYIYFYRSPLTAALFLATALIFVYIPPDFLLRPYIINRASNLHPLLIILAFIGGGVAGGLSGFFAAPLAVGFITAVYRTYKKIAGQESDESLH
jgi:predicted PurR-regulated permease PerM